MRQPTLDPIKAVGIAHSVCQTRLVLNVLIDFLPSLATTCDPQLDGPLYADQSLFRGHFDYELGVEACRAF